VNAHLVDMLADTAAHRTGGRIIGVVIGVVTKNKDEDGLNRVAVQFPWLGQNIESWARVAAPMAGNDRGMYFFPEPQDEVLVMFERGDVRFPFVIGALWNGKDAPPVGDDDNRDNNVRMIKSRSGHVIKLNDKDGEETVEIVDKANNRIVIDTKNNTITISSGKDIALSAPDGKISLTAQVVEVRSSSTMTIHADGNMEASSSAHLKLAGNSVDIN
jgi:uncharacterized protein involved in type VI secretion and phage assembly